MCHSLLLYRCQRLLSAWIVALSVVSLCLLDEQVSSQEITWEPLGLSGGGGMFAPAISPVDPDLMLIHCDMSGAYLSKDGGHHWRMINHRQLRSDTGCRPAFHPRDPQVLYASSSGQLRVSHDQGDTFASIGNLEESLCGEIAIDSSQPNRMLVGTRDGHCFMSLDAGETWTVCAGPRGQLIGFHFDQTSAGRMLVAATDQGIWRSDDAGRTWTDRTQGLPWRDIQGFAAGSHADSGVVISRFCIRKTSPSIRTTAPTS